MTKFHTRVSKIERLRVMIRLIVGLGNPGFEYDHTRHNAGFWFLDALASKYQASFSVNSKFFALSAKFTYLNQDIWLLKPQTYMNLSGKAVQGIASFYKIVPSEIIVIHDELDFVPGVVKLKHGGGNGGHNGLKDIDRVIGKDYWRLRLGIGHPGDRNKVADYVLKKPIIDDKLKIDLASQKVLDHFDLILDSRFDEAMKIIHSQINE